MAAAPVARSPRRRGGAATDAPPRHLAGVDGLRAIAAGLVVLTHVGYLSGVADTEPFGPFLARMDVGVPIFFVISGFLLYRPWAGAHLAGRPRPDWRTYARHRVLRLVPAYWLALTIILFGLQGGADVHGALDVVVYYGFLQTYDPVRLFGGIPQAWSLCLEVAFYLFLPLYAWAVGRAGRRAPDPAARLRVEVVAPLVLIAVALADRLWLLAFDRSEARLGMVWLPANLDLFALGILLAVAAAWTSHQGRPPRLVALLSGHPGACWAVAGVAFATVSLALDLPRDLGDPSIARSMAQHILYAVTAVFLVAPAVLGAGEGGAVRSLLRWRPLVAAGLISYGLFLWHQAWVEEAIGWTGDEPTRAAFLPLLAAGIGLGLVSGAVSYLAVERPTRLLRERRSMAGAGR